MSLAVPKQKISQINRPAIRFVPPWFIEYGFYATVVYSLLGPVLGLQIDRLGIVMLVGLASLSSLYIMERPRDFFRTLVFPVGLVISFLLIQMMYHGLSINQGYVKPFIPWICTLFVVLALTGRPGFFHRFMIFALLIGSIFLFFLDFREGGDGVVRMGLEKGAVGGMSNPNSLGAWFGFCTVYFFMLGLVTGRQKTRFVSWVIAFGCLFVVTLTVSRGVLLATIIAIILGSREFLKRGFLPLFLLFVLAWVAYGMGLFDQAITFYTMRATEESGRFLVWPLAFEAFLNAPLTGVGASNAEVFVPVAAKKITPHNGFLLIAMASGIFPLIFYAAYWIQATWAALKQQTERTENAKVFLPLVAYAFLICLSGNMTFMEPWVVVTIATTVISQNRNSASLSKHNSV